MGIQLSNITWIDDMKNLWQLKKAAVVEFNVWLPYITTDLLLEDHKCGFIFVVGWGEGCVSFIPAQILLNIEQLISRIKKPCVCNSRNVSLVIYFMVICLIRIDTEGTNANNDGGKTWTQKLRLPKNDYYMCVFGMVMATAYMLGFGVFIARYRAHSKYHNIVSSQQFLIHFHRHRTTLVLHLALL